MNLFEMTRSSGPRRNNWQKKISLDVYTSGHLKAVSLGAKWIFLSTYLSSNTHGISEIFLCITHWKFFFKATTSSSALLYGYIYIYIKRRRQRVLDLWLWQHPLLWNVTVCVRSLNCSTAQTEQTESECEGERVWVCVCERERVREREKLSSRQYCQVCMSSYARCKGYAVYSNKRPHLVYMHNVHVHIICVCVRFFAILYTARANAITAAVSHYPGRRNTTCKNSEITNLSYSHTCLKMSRSHSKIIRFSRLSFIFPCVLFCVWKTFDIFGDNTKLSIIFKISKYNLK